MAPGPGIPYIHDRDFRSIAVSFLREQGACESYPVDIENIVDVKLGIDIVPIPGLGDVIHDGVAFISNDLSSITVDQYIYEHRRRPYRFCLAHEISHRLLHADMLADYTISSIDQYRSYLATINAMDYARMEFQADQLAGLILVPPHHLGQCFQDARQMAADAGVDIDNAGPAGLVYVAGHLAEMFDVSRSVIEIRMRNDGLGCIPLSPNRI